MDTLKDLELLKKDLQNKARTLEVPTLGADDFPDNYPSTPTEIAFEEGRLRFGYIEDKSGIVYDYWYQENPSKVSKGILVRLTIFIYEDEPILYRITIVDIRPDGRIVKVRRVFDIDNPQGRRFTEEEAKVQDKSTNVPPDEEELYVKKALQLLHQEAEKV